MDEIHILVVDDDTGIRDLLQRFLSKEGFRVSIAADAPEARAQMRNFQFDLLVIDVMMPGESGLDLTRELRRLGTVPILMLTAMGQTEARIAGLQAGADDYLPKPFEPQELVLRIRSILRRARTAGQPAAPAEIRMGDVRFDPARGILLRDDTPLRLTTAEAALLKMLADPAGRVLERETLSEECLNGGGARAVDVQVARLRRKLEPDPKTPRYLQTVRGRGYVLRPDS